MSLQRTALATIAILNLVAAHSTRESKLSPRLKSHLEGADHYEKVVKTEQTPQVQLKSYVFDITRSYDLLDGNDIKNNEYWTDAEFSTVGVSGTFTGDIYASAQSPAFWL